MEIKKTVKDFKKVMAFLMEKRPIVGQFLLNKFELEEYEKRDGAI